MPEFRVISSYLTSLNPAQAGLELPSSCLSLLNARVSGMHPYTHLIEPSMFVLHV